MTVHCREKRFNMGDAERGREGRGGRPGPERKFRSETLIHLFIYINPPQLPTTQQQYDATEVKYVDLQSDVRKNVCAKIHS